MDTRRERPARTPRGLAPGEAVASWVVVNQMASGGFGAVYEVRHAKSGEHAALKLLHAHLMTSAETLARFEREIHIVKTLRHDNIVRLVDAGFASDGRPYLCMELLEGEELNQAIVCEEGLAVPRALEVLESVCDAAATAHDLGIIHRDIKSRNIMLCSGGRVVLLDFGIARINDAFASELTATNQSLGTPACMAPEQIHGTRPDPRTDVYALGGLLFHMLTGRQPFDDPSPTMIQYLHVNAKRPRASLVKEGIPDLLDDVIVRAMAIDPAQRFPDARSFLAAALVAGRGTRIASAPAVVDGIGLMVTVTDTTGGTAYDPNLLDDLDAVMPAADRLLSAAGFTLAVDLGSSAVFVAAADRVANPSRFAIEIYEHLDARPGRDARVAIGVCVHRGALTYSATEILPSELLRPATWAIPDALVGVWATGAIRPPSGRRLR